MFVIVVGGGVGGLATGLALQRANFDYLILERARELTDVGAGFWLTANGIKVLRHLDCEQRLMQTAVRVEDQVTRRLEDNSLIYTTKLGATAEAQYGAPSVFSHRRDLLSALYAGLDPSRVRLAARVMSYEEHSDHVQVHLESGETLRCDLLVGADGLSSSVRQQRFGVEAPRFSGIVCWRAVFPSSRLKFSPGPAQRNWVGVGRSVVSYLMRRGELYNFVGFVPAGEVKRESWTKSGDVGDMRRSFAGACSEVTDIIDAIDEAFITGLYFRDPLSSWSTARTTLLGDAAHPMLPTAGQGAQMSLEDAVTLVGCLLRHRETDIAAALDEYSRRRIPRTAQVQAVARANARDMNAPDPKLTDAFQRRYRGVLQLDPIGAVTTAWMYGHDALKALEQPADQITGPDTAYIVKRMQRPEAQRAFDLCRGALTAEDRSGSWLGERAGYERFCREQFPVPADVKVRSHLCDGVPMLEVLPPLDTGGPVVLHLHGGGYTRGSAHGSLAVAARLAAAVGGSAFTVDYRLAPEHPSPAALVDTQKAYRWLAERVGDASRIILAGESAGAGLALSLAVGLRDQGAPLPRLIYTVSPMVDLTLSAPSIAQHEGEDPCMNRETLLWMAASYVHDRSPADPQLSPLFADLRGLPPLLIHVAQDEALYDDAARLADAARRAGMQTTFTAFPDTVHDFILFDFLPDTRQAMSQLALLARQRR